MTQTITPPRATLGLRRRRARPGTGAGPGALAEPADHPGRRLPAGGQTDFAARVLQNGLQQALGEPVVIDNRGGAGGNLGTETVCGPSRTATRCWSAMPTRWSSTRTPCRR